MSRGLWTQEAEETLGPLLEVPIPYGLSASGFSRGLHGTIESMEKIQRIHETEWEKNFAF